MAAWGDYKEFAERCKEEVRKAKAQLQLRFACSKSEGEILGMKFSQVKYWVLHSGHITPSLEHSGV